MLALLLPAALAAEPTYADLLTRLDAVAESLEADPDVQAHWGALVAAHGLADTPAAYDEFVHVRIVHEALRDGGWAGLRWDITDQAPDSTRLWAAWRGGAAGPVTAECDELSAIFAMVARGLGVDHVGLFWPTWNHTVAVWTTPGEDGRPVRVVVPTSQVFLTATAGLGDTGFDPRTQKTIYDYGQKDLAKDAPLPTVVVDRIVEGAERFGGEPTTALVRRRLGSSWR